MVIIFPPSTKGPAMKKILPLIILLVFIVSCNLPFNPAEPAATGTPNIIVVTATPPAHIPDVVTLSPVEPTPGPVVTATPPGTPLTLSGISMRVPGCLPVSESLEFVPAQLYDPMGGPQEVFPAHRRVNFSGYPLSGTFFSPFMRVFPVADFATAYALADEDYSATTITQLQELLATRPPAVEGSLPFLVMAGAAQIFHTKMAYLDFVNGSGVRYLTSYGQYSVPYNNHDLFYTFQGLTADCKYWVSVIFPVNHPVLPPTYDSTAVPPGGMPIPSWDSPTYEEDMRTYYAAMQGIMTASADASFVPGLDCLDQYIQSLNIGD